MNETMSRVWAVALSRQLASLLEYKCGDFEAFCEGLQGADEEQIVTAICLLTSA